MVTRFSNGFKISTAVVTALVMAAIGGCGGDASAPKGFGVNVTVDAKGVPEADRKRIARGRLLASVGSPSDLADVKGIQSGELRFRFIPVVTSGPLVLTLEALDAAGALVARGASAPVEIIAGSAVAAVITLSPDARKTISTACTSNEECSSNFCVDGVCCNTACSGICESCAVANAVGTCSPVADDTDPQMECVAPSAAAPAADAGVVADAGVEADGGTELNVPDGGLMGNEAVCAGKCNGKRACKYPGPTTSCGAKWCNEATSPGAMVCNGAGMCGPQLTQCVDYTCGDGSCRTQCARHEDCQTETRYCGVNNTCLPKKANGIACNVASECSSGHCSGEPGAKVCCNTACDSPLRCTEEPAGNCKCQNVTCADGIACQVYYRDADGDSFGDMFGTLANKGAQPACAGAPPLGYVANNQDCDDEDLNAKPGQTAFFPTASAGKRTFDYDCDGELTKQTPAYGATCGFYSGAECTAENTSTVCKAASNRAGNGCAVSCLGIFDPGKVTPIDGITISIGTIGPILIPRCRTVPKDGYISDVACGAVGLLRTCGTCAAAGDKASPSDTKQTQACR